jgi:hypothetical protein
LLEFVEISFLNLLLKIISFDDMLKKVMESLEYVEIIKILLFAYIENLLNIMYEEDSKVQV